MIKIFYLLFLSNLASFQIFSYFKLICQLFNCIWLLLNRIWLPFNGTYPQCDQIGRFIELWASFQSLWQQFYCPNYPYFRWFFVKVSKSLIFLVKSFLSNFYRHLATFYWSHCLPMTFQLLTFPPISQLLKIICIF